MKPLLGLTVLALVLTGCASTQSQISPDFASSYADPIYNPAQVTVPPRLVRWPGVNLPSTLKVAGSRASTHLTVIVKPDGSAVVENVISQSDGPFTAAVVKAVGRSLYSPGILNGYKVATRIIVPMTYVRDDSVISENVIEPAFDVHIPNTTPDMDNWGK